MLNRKRLLGVLAATIVILGIGAGNVGAATLHVRNNGADGAACGTVAAPCRSISRAIANAVAKDRILVGPGRYGDLNGNGILGEPGEEPGSIFVNKPLTLESEEGAGATVIDMSGLHLDVLRVTAGAAGSVIGLPARGFTLSSGGWGLSTEPGLPGLLSISGNVAVNNIENGFLLHAPATYFVTNNLALRNGTTGFLVHGGTGHKFRENAAVSNGSDGFSADLGSGHEFTGNLAIGNSLMGFHMSLDTGLTLRNNSALGNTLLGMGFFITTATATQNNIYGNDPASNCGLQIVDSTVNAANNFFGAATGPGSDPADEVCVVSGSLVYLPFGPLEFAIATTWK